MRPIRIVCKGSLLVLSFGILGFGVLDFGVLGLGVLRFGLPGLESLGLALVVSIVGWHPGDCFGEHEIQFVGSFWNVFVVAKLRTRFGSKWEDVVCESEGVRGKVRFDEEVEIIFIGACEISLDEIRKGKSFVVSHCLLVLLHGQ